MGVFAGFMLLLLLVVNIAPPSTKIKLGELQTDLLGLLVLCKFLLYLNFVTTTVDSFVSKISLSSQVCYL